MPRRPQKRTAERRRQRPQSPIAIDPLVGPRNPSHRHPPCAKTDQPRSLHCMVHLATRTSSHRSKSSYQAKYATVMLEPVREHIESSESFVIQGRRPDSLGGSPMWTSKNRRRYDRSRLRYPSDLTDEEWALVEPLIAPAKRGGNRRHVVVREVVNGLMYILSTGCQWRAIAKDLPPRSTLYDYFDLWGWDGTLDRIHDALYAQCRQATAREASPTAAIIDSQSVKSAFYIELMMYEIER